jgi:anti-anti-sigma factor
MIFAMGELFSVSAQTDGDSAVITAAGEFDLAAASEFTACADPLLPAAQHVVIDLRDVSFLDSSGLNALLTYRRSANAAGGAISLRSPTDRVRRLLELAGVTDILPIDQ